MSGPIGVLYADADPGAIASTVTALERRDSSLSVEGVTDTSQGVDRLTAGEFDCLVTAQELQTGTGVDLLRTVRERGFEGPAVLFVETGSGTLASEASAAGATGYVQRDAHDDEYGVLADRISTAVERFRTQTVGGRVGRPDEGVGGTDDGIEQHLQAVAARAEDVLWIFTPDWSETLFVNEAYEDIWGRPVSELETNPRAFLEGIHPADQPDAAEAMDRLVAGEPFDLELRVNESEEYGRWIWSKGYPIFDGAGEVDYVAGFTRDITERKERERALSALHGAAREIVEADEKADVYETLAQSADEILDFDLATVDVARGDVLEMVAWTFDLDEEPHYQTVSLSEDDTFGSRAYNSGETILVDDLRDYEIVGADPDYLSGLTVPIGEMGVFQGISREVAAFDGTDRELAEILVEHARVKLAQLDDRRQLEERTAELERQNERLDEFASVVSHDLRNPLNVAISRLELAQRECDSEHLDAATRAHERMESLIADLLTLARGGKPVDETEPVDLARVIESCWWNVETAGASLVTDTDLTVDADRGRLQQLLENLVRNAVEHGSTGSQNAQRSDDAVEHGSTSPDSEARQDAVEHGSTSPQETADAVEPEPAGVTITVGTLEDGDGFFVADDGPGIPEDERDSVFDSGYTTAQEGTGFGLSIVGEIAQAHGWSVTVTESADGGARFEISGVGTGT